MALNLSPGERIIFQGHPSWRAILGFYLKGILVAALAGVVFKLFGADGGTVFLVVLLIVAVTVLAGFLKRVATTYSITNRRLNIKRGAPIEDPEKAAKPPARLRISRRA